MSSPLGFPSFDNPFSQRLDPQWSAQWIRRTLTDEPGKGMGAPFSEAQAQLFLRVCGRNPGVSAADYADMALLDRMWFWIDTHR
ncbi:MAG: hypothetical protein JWN73_599 [Betaproteobacteria bacterium]|nr:hypothetical protein [Betaproteobacteria bacterium]